MPTPRLQPAIASSVVTATRQSVQGSAQSNTPFAAYLNEPDAPPAGTNAPFISRTTSSALQGGFSHKQDLPETEPPGNAASVPSGYPAEHGPSAASEHSGVSDSGSASATMRDTPMRQRIFGFVDLGMFGLSAADLDASGETVANQSRDMAALSTGTGPNSVGKPQRVADGTEESVMPRSSNADVAAADDQSDFVGQRLGRSEAVEYSGGADRAVSFGRYSASATPTPVMGGVFDTPEVPTELDEGPPAKPEAATLPPLGSENAGQNFVNLVVSGSEAMLSIAVRVQGETDPAGLRQLLENTAAEFDMQLGEFHLNGAPGPSPSPTGGSRGSYTR